MTLRPRAQWRVISGPKACPGTISCRPALPISAGACGRTRLRDYLIFDFASIPPFLKLLPALPAPPASHIIGFFWGSHVTGRVCSFFFSVVLALKVFNSPRPTFPWIQMVTRAIRVRSFITIWQTGFFADCPDTISVAPFLRVGLCRYMGALGRK